MSGSIFALLMLHGRDACRFLSLLPMSLVLLHKNGWQRAISLGTMYPPWCELGANTRGLTQPTYIGPIQPGW